MSRWGCTVAGWVQTGALEGEAVAKAVDMATLKVNDLCLLYLFLFF